MEEAQVTEKKRGRPAKTFAEIETPMSEHAKEVAKENSRKKVVPRKEFYTIENGKVLKITVKPNGAYSTFIAREETITKAEINKWKKEGKFVYSHEKDEVCSAFIESCKKG